MLFEVFHVFRVIPIDAKHPDDLEPSFMGDSVGHWEGDTLVVDAIGFNDKTWLAGTGTFHSDKLHVIEKFTRMDQNTIAYEVSTEDPEVLTNNGSSAAPSCFGRARVFGNTNAWRTTRIWTATRSC
jgi:hypothetical protein